MVDNWFGAIPDCRWANLVGSTEAKRQIPEHRRNSSGPAREFSSNGLIRRYS